MDPKASMWFRGPAQRLLPCCAEASRSARGRQRSPARPDERADIFRYLSPEWLGRQEADAFHLVVRAHANDRMVAKAGADPGSLVIRTQEVKGG